MKKIFLMALALFAFVYASAQPPDTSDVYNSYLDLNMAMFEGNTDYAISISNGILPDTAALPKNARINYYNILGKLYENDDTAEAIKYYTRVTAAVPHYYVAHRALGYLYLKQAQQAEQKEGLTSKAFIQVAKSALPYLEKAQACDPGDDTLTDIKWLYNKLKDSAGLKALNTRLAAMAKNCEDLLQTQ